jgi:hypothetical protein
VPIQPDVDVRARALTDASARREGAPEWAEVLLSIGPDPNHGGTTNRYLTRNAGYTVMDELNSVLRPWAGRRLVDMLWEELDSITDRLMRDAPEDSWGDEEWNSYNQDVGAARGIAYCIAIITNPYNPSIDAIREIAMERYENPPPPRAVEKKRGKK